LKKSIALVSSLADASPGSKNVARLWGKQRRPFFMPEVAAKPQRIKPSVTEMMPRYFKV
jgi:hypothetical protein